ncbi:hypothetical protein ACS8E6_15110 [Salinicola halophyticus]|uniref:hypothetical protein n=1 Tax=Salinicola halophyticus TaxID=1808881 RepID=UPI003F469443
MNIVLLVTSYLYDQVPLWRRLPDERHQVEDTVLLRSPPVDNVKKAMQTGKLMRVGVVLSPNYDYRTEFLFTGLNDLKPEMVVEATADAQGVAQQSARDSGRRVGAIEGQPRLLLDRGS